MSATVRQGAWKLSSREPLAGFSLKMKLGLDWSELMSAHQRLAPSNARPGSSRAQQS
jgi:hypothetical protein